MLKVLPAIEGYVLTNIATQGLFNANPLEFLLGDLNAQAGPGAIGQLMGPSSTGAITLKELLTNSMNTMTTQTYYSPSMGKYGTRQVMGSTGGVIDQVSQNFMDNLGSIVIGTAISTAGFKIARRALRKPINMANRQLRAFNLGSTIQI
jgi:uncharacterized membrane protein